MHPPSKERNNMYKSLASEAEQFVLSCAAQPKFGCKLTNFESARCTLPGGCVNKNYVTKCEKQCMICAVCKSYISCILNLNVVLYSLMMDMSTLIDSDEYYCYYLSWSSQLNLRNYLNEMSYPQPRHFTHLFLMPTMAQSRNRVAV